LKEYTTITARLPQGQMLQVVDFLLRGRPNHQPSTNKARCIIDTIDQLIVVAKGCTEPPCLRSEMGFVVALWEECCVVVLFVTKELQSKSIS
jgi:hypothetical protein